MTIIEKYDNGTMYFQFERFMDIDYIDHLFTSKIGWDNNNYKNKISNIFQIPENKIVNVKQVHGTNIEIVDKKLNNFGEIAEIEADGLITNLPNIVLTTYHADCVPIYFLDTKKKIIAIAHAGWKGTFKNVGGKMIEIMNRKYNSNNEDILVGIGPSIGVCCYEIGKDLAENFNERYNEFSQVLIKRNNKMFLDLWKLNYFQIKEKGIPKTNIILSNTCTSCKMNKFHSYRREKGTKSRMVAAIRLIDKCKG